MPARLLQSNVLDLGDASQSLNQSINQSTDLSSRLWTQYRELNKQTTTGKATDTKH